MGYGFSGFDYYAGFSGAFQQMGTNYYLSGSMYDTTKEADAVLWKFNAKLDTLLFKRYSYLGFNVFRHCQPTLDGGLVILGETNPTASNTQIWLLKVDSMGNVLWEKQYGGNKTEYPRNVLIDDDFGYVLSGVTESFGAGSFDAYIVKVDSVGKEIWSKTYGDKNSNGGYALIKSKFGGFIGSGGEFDTIINTYTNLHPSIIRLDSVGNVLWKKTYGDSRYGSGLTVVHELADGSIVSAGQINENKTTGSFRGMLLKTNSQGDSLWYREYEYNPCNGNDDYIRDMKPTSDGGFIMAGFFHLNPSECPGDTGTQDMWVIKLDSIGCPYPNCDTIMGVIPLLPPVAAVRVYPNPAHERFSLQGNLSYPVTVELYDVQGKKISEQQLFENESFSVQTLHRGLYIYKVTEHNGNVSRGKVVIE